MDIKLFEFARGRGIATQALLYSIQEAFKQGAENLWVDPHPANAKAINLYRKLGFIQKEMPEYVIALGEDPSLYIYMELGKKEFNDKKAELSSEKKSLSAKKADVKSSEELLESKQSEVTAKRAESYKILSELDKDSKEFKEAIAAYEAEQKRVEAEMDRIILERGSTTKDKVEDSSDSDSGEEIKSSGKYVKDPLKNMQWPVPYNNCYISAGFGWYSPFGVKRWHNGMDICVHGGSEGFYRVGALRGEAGGGER